MIDIVQYCSSFLMVVVISTVLLCKARFSFYYVYKQYKKRILVLSIAILLTISVSILAWVEMINLYLDCIQKIEGDNIFKIRNDLECARRLAGYDGFWVFYSFQYYS